MKEKIKVLFVRSKKLKHKVSKDTLEYLIDRETPDTYEFINAYIWENILEIIDKESPGIVFLSQNKLVDILELVKKIKSVYPSVAIFLISSDMVNDEQATIDAYIAAGVYKCYFSALVIDTLVHDMYVALNLE